MAPTKEPGKFSIVKSKPQQCLFCSKVYLHYQTLESHTNLHTGENPYECQDCGDTFAYFSYLQRHQSLVHLGQRFPCKLCSASYAGNQNLQSHMDRIHHGKKYICSVCRTQYSSQFTLKRHKCNGVKKTLCKVRRPQDKRFKGIYKQVEKEEKPKKNRKSKSPEPRKEFNSFVENRKELVIKGNSSKRRKTFPKFQLPHQCVLCSKVYQGSSALEVHMNLHTGERPYECTECPATFPDHRYLSTHMDLVHRNKRYPCDLCSDVFKESFYLRRHRDIVHYGKKYICGGCHQEYYSQATLNRHRDRGSCSGVVKKISHPDKGRRVFGVQAGIIKGVAKKSGNVIGKDGKNQSDFHVNASGDTKQMSVKINLEASKTVRMVIRKVGKNQWDRNAQGSGDTIKKSSRIKKEPLKSSLIDKKSVTGNVKMKGKYGIGKRMIKNLSKCPLKVKSRGNVDQKPNVIQKSSVSQRNQVYKCTQCPTTYLDRNLLLRHAADCHGRQIFRCSVCQNLYTNYSNMFRHMKTSHPNDNYAVLGKRDTKCVRCNLMFDNYPLLIQHKKDKHNLKMVKCTYCPNEYTDHSNMLRHRKSHATPGNVDMKPSIRLPKVYETENTNKKIKREVPQFSTESEELKDNLEEYPVIVDVDKTGISSDNGPVSNQAYQHLLEIVNQVRIQNEQKLEKDVSFFLHLNRYDPSSI